MWSRGTVAAAFGAAVAWVGALGFTLADLLDAGQRWGSAENLCLAAAVTMSLGIVHGRAALKEMTVYELGVAQGVRQERLDWELAELVDPR